MENGPYNITTSNPYPYKKGQYEKQTVHLQAWRGSARAKELIASYIQFLFSKGDGEGTATKRLCLLRRAFDLTPKDPDQLTMQDIQVLTSKINRELKSQSLGRVDEPLAESTKADYRKEVRRFYVWYEDFDPRLKSDSYRVREEAVAFYKYVRRNLSAAYKKTALDYSGIINDEDFRKLIPACRSPKERAAVATLFYTGVRASELLGMRVKDVEDKGGYAMIRVDGKTGERRVPVLEALPYLAQYLKEHPYRDNPSALLWLGDRHRDRYRPLEHVGLCLVLKRVFARAGVDKKDNPHWMRHSRATLWAPQYSELVLCKMMGWKPGSAQVRTYVHLGAVQVETAFLQANNLAQAPKKESEIVACSVCNTPNNRNDTHCHLCLRPLSMQAVLESEKRKEDAINQALQQLKEIMKNPQLREAFLVADGLL